MFAYSLSTALGRRAAFGGSLDECGNWARSGSARGRVLYYSSSSSEYVVLEYPDTAISRVSTVYAYPDTMVTTGTVPGTRVRRARLGTAAACGLGHARSATAAAADFGTL